MCGFDFEEQISTRYTPSETILHRLLSEVKNMAVFGCNCRCNCTAAAIIASAVIGVLTAFFQITGVITVTTAFLWVAFGIAVVYLGVLVVAASLERRTEACNGMCSALNTLLAGILGTILFAVVLLAVGIIATSVFNAILVGLLLFFFALIFTSAACFARCLADCGN